MMMNRPSLCCTPAHRQSSRVAECTANLPISCLRNRQHLRSGVDLRLYLDAVTYR